METNWGRQDFAVLNRNVLVFGLTDYLDNDAGQGDLIFETRKSTPAPSRPNVASLDCTDFVRSETAPNWRVSSTNPVRS